MAEPSWDFYGNLQKSANNKKDKNEKELAVNAQVEVMAKYLGHGMSLKGRFYMLFAKK